MRSTNSRRSYRLADTDSRLYGDAHLRATVVPLCSGHAFAQLHDRGYLRNTVKVLSRRPFQRIDESGVPSPMTTTDVRFAQRPAQPHPWRGYRRVSALVGIAAAIAMVSVSAACGSNSKTGPTTTTTTTTTTTSSTASSGGGGGPQGGHGPHKSGGEAPVVTGAPDTVTNTETQIQTSIQTSVETDTQT